MVKKISKISLCFVLLMSLIMTLGINVEANETKEQQNLSKDLSEFNLSLKEESGVTKVEVTLQGNKAPLSSVSFTLSENGKKEYAYTTLQFVSEGKYKGEFKNNALKKGVYKIDQINLYDENKDLYYFDRNCNDELCVDCSSLMKDKWDNYTITGTQEKELPIIKSLHGSGFTENIDVNTHKFKVEYVISNADKFTSTRLHFFYRNSNGERESLYFESSGQEIHADRNWQYRGKDYTLDAISVNAFGGDSNNQYGSQTIYSVLSMEEYTKEYGEPEAGTLSLLSDVTTERFDFSVKDFISDTKAPELLKIDWKENEVSLPGLATIEFEAKDLADSGSKGAGVQNIGFITNAKDLHIVKAGLYFDEHGGTKGYNTYSFGRYDSTTPLEIYGIRLYDNVGNESVYVRDLDEIVDGQFHGIHIEKNDALEWQQPIKKLNFNRTQDYERILDNTTNYIDVLEKAKDGEIYVINTSAYSVIKKEIFETIKGKDITLIFEEVTGYEFSKSGIQWIMNGKDIKTPKTIDTKTGVFLGNSKVNIPPASSGSFMLPVGYWGELSLAENNQKLMDSFNDDVFGYYYEYLKKFNVNTDNFVKEALDEFGRHQQVDFNFKANGELPGKATIRFKMDYMFRNHMPAKGLKIFYVNGDENELIQDGIGMDEEGYYDFDIMHNSKYILTSKKLSENTAPEENTNESTTPEENTNESTTPKDNTNEKKPPVNAGDTSESASLILLLMGSAYILLRRMILQSR